MPSDLTLYFIDLFRKIDYPISEEITEEAIAFFEYGNDMLMMYRGNPDLLFQAVRTYWACNSAPFGYAGAANVLVCASYSSGGNYEREGLYHASLLIDKAKYLAPDNYEIESIEAQVYNTQKDANKMRAVLNKLRRYPDVKTRSDYARMEMAYADLIGDIDKARQWYKRALDLVENDMRRVSLISHMAGILLRKKGYQEEVIELYRQVVQLDPNDPWAWHNLSLIYLNRNENDKAGECNRHALDLMPFQMAEMITKKLVDRWQRGQHKDPLKEYPRYLASTTARPENKAFNWLFGNEK